MAEAVVIEPPSQPPSMRPPEQLHFTGKASEYFGIWIVNLLLTIVTLGIYSPWAKVRRLHYFYRHTELAGSSFDFHGSPVKILIGRAIAVCMLVAYKILAGIKSPLIFVIIAVAAVALPWLLRNSLRFRLYNTSWRGTRFHFRGSAKGAYRVFLLNGVLTVITLYLMAPFAHQRLKAYQHNNSTFGTTPCSFHARARQFYLTYLVLLAAIVAFAIVAFIGFQLLGITMPAPKPGSPPNPRAIFQILAVFYGAAILVGVAILPAFSALITNLIWNNTRIGAHHIECRMSPLAVIWIAVSNFVVVMFSLGFMIPWAIIRWTRYRVESVRLLPGGDLQAITEGEPEKIGAVGEETASVFDIDISL